jgi:hypothetical protein
MRPGKRQPPVGPRALLHKQIIPSHKRDLENWSQNTANGRVRQILSWWYRHPWNVSAFRDEHSCSDECYVEC